MTTRGSIAAVAFCVIGATGAGAQRAAPPDPRHPLDQLPIVGRVDLPSSADWIAFGFGSIWVVNYRPDRVSRVDSVTLKVTADIPIGRNGCLGLVVDAGRVWVPSCVDGVMNEIDPRVDSIVRKTPVPIKSGREGAFAMLGGSFWMPDNATDSISNGVARVDMKTGAVLAHIETGARTDVTTAGFGSVWATSSGENVVVRIDAATNRVAARIPVGRSPKFTAAGEGAIWVQNREDGSVSRIDPATNKEVARIDAWSPTQAGDISAGGGYVWLTANGMPVTRIDPRTNRVTHQYVGGDGADAIRWGAGAVWVGDHKIGQLWKIDANRIP